MQGEVGLIGADERSEVFARCTHDDRKDGLPCVLSQEVLPVKRQEMCGFPCACTGEDMGVLGGDDLTGGTDLCLGRIRHDFRVELSDQVIELNECGGGKLGMQIALGLP